MTPEAQRIAIALACGFKWSSTDELYDPTAPERGPGCPDYLTDLNACHEMEKTLDWLENVYGGGPVDQYLQWLIRLNNGRMWNATAAQRAEAFLRCTGRWEDSK